MECGAKSTQRGTVLGIDAIYRGHTLWCFVECVVLDSTLAFILVAAHIHDIEAAQRRLQTTRLGVGHQDTDLRAWPMI